MIRCILLLCLALAAMGCSEFLRWTGPERAPPSHWPEEEEASISPRRDEAGAGEYRVQAGDTVFSIAFRNQLDAHQLAQWNDLGSGNLIRPGDVLRLTPPPGRVATPPSGIASRPLTPLPAPVEQRLAFIWTWPAPGDVAKRFGPSAGSKGVDIEGTLGQSVLAAAPGKVVYSGSALRGYGELIIIKHDDVYLSAYGYNRKRLVQEGESVKAQQAIAELGLGPERKPVVHFEIRRRGKPVNPLELLPPR